MATPAENITTLPTIEVLAQRLAEAKAAESAAIEARLAVEAEILAHPSTGRVLVDEGTATVADRIKVTTGYTRKWEQSTLANLAHSIDPAYWPFKVEFKEDRKAARVIEERFPDLWERLRHALTLTPRKPSIALVEPKDGDA